MAKSRNEQLLEALLNGETADIVPQSRNEAYLKAMIEGNTEVAEPRSRIEAYLCALARNGSSGGGSGIPQADIDSAFAALAEKGVTVPDGATSADLDELIASIVTGGGETLEIATGEYIPSEDILLHYSLEDTEAKIDTGLGYLPKVFVVLDMRVSTPTYSVLGNCHWFRTQLGSDLSTDVLYSGSSWAKTAAGSSGNKVLISNNGVYDDTRASEMEKGIMPVDAAWASGDYYLRAGVTYTWFAIGRVSK